MKKRNLEDRALIWFMYSLGMFALTILARAPAWISTLAALLCAMWWANWVAAVVIRILGGDKTDRRDR